MSWRTFHAPPMIRHPKQWTILLDALEPDRYLTADQAADKAQLTHKRARHYLFVARVLGLVEQVKRHNRPDLYRVNGKT